MLHDLIALWFEWVRDWGYWGVFLLMAAESSILPVPSEIVVPPAAYWASQGRMSFTGVVVAGTLGSLFGAMVMYWGSRWLGRPLILRYGRWIFCPPEKLARAERFLERYELGGVFFARLIPVVRHLIGIPAGIVRMRPLPYAAMTVLGSALWCWILAWFGESVLGDRPDLIEDPAALVGVLHDKLWWFGAAALILLVLYVAVLRLTAARRGADRREPAGE